MGDENYFTKLNDSYSSIKNSAEKLGRISKGFSRLAQAFKVYEAALAKQAKVYAELNNPKNRGEFSTRTEPLKKGIETILDPEFLEDHIPSFNYTWTRDKMGFSNRYMLRPSFDYAKLLIQEYKDRNLLPLSFGLIPKRIYTLNIEADNVTIAYCLDEEMGLISIFLPNNDEALKNKYLLTLK